MKYQKFTHRTGMLSVVYPNVWTLKEYPGDPRAKIEFLLPSDALVVRLIVTPAPGQVLSDFISHWSERELAFRALGIKPEIGATSVRGADARVIKLHRKDVEQELLLFVEAGLYCNFSFECSPRAWSQNKKEFAQLVENARLTPPSKLSGEQELSQTLASRIRRAELGIAGGNYTLAYEAIQEGLKLDPRNQRLLEIRKQIHHMTPYYAVSLGVKQQAEKIKNALVSVRLLGVILPFVGVVVVDSLRLSFWFALPLIIFPFRDLKRQIRVWLAQLRTFGRPELTKMRRMVRLDALRVYDATRDDLPDETERNLFADAILFVLIAALSSYLSWITGSYSPLYVASFSIMLVVKALIRRCRPPAILLLGASGSAVTLLHLALLDCAKPLEVVSLLRHTPTSWVADSTLRFLNFRTRPSADWQEVVAEIVAISSIVVVDMRYSTDALQFERQLCETDRSPDRLFIVQDNPDSGPLAARTFDSRSVTHAVESYIAELRSSRTRRLI